MLRATVADGQPEVDPFLPLALNLPELEDGIIADLDDSNMSDWLGRLSPNGITPEQVELLSVTDLFGISGSGLIGAESDLDVKSPEKFQDLRFTSTPKSKRAADSGFAECTPSNTSGEYKVVLNDITDKLKADFFTSLSDVCEFSPNLKVSQEDSTKTPVKRPLNADENRSDESSSHDGVWERNVSIIRRRIRTIPGSRPVNILKRGGALLESEGFVAAPLGQEDRKRPKNAKQAAKPVASSSLSCSGCKKTSSEETQISEAELLYYTGIRKHRSALGVIKFMRLPVYPKLSSFKRFLVTIMKLRFDFPYEDLGFRLRVGTSVVKDIISKTAALMAASLVDFVPWLEPATTERTHRRTFFLHEIYDEEMKIVVLVEDRSHLPICFVSESYSSQFEGIAIALASCATHFANNDLVCAVIADNPLFYRIARPENGEAAYELAEGRVNEGAVDSFLGRNQTIVSQLESYRSTNIDRRSEDDCLPYEVAVKISAALVNVNHLHDEELLNFLQKVYTRSSAASLVAALP